MSTDAQTGSRLGYWLSEEVKPWQILPLFLLFAFGAWGFGVSVVGSIPGLEPIPGEQMIAGSAILAGVLMGWTARRLYETDS